MYTQLEDKFPNLSYNWILPLGLRTYSYWNSETMKLSLSYTKIQKLSYLGKNKIQHYHLKKPNSKEDIFQIKVTSKHKDNKSKDNNVNWKLSKF